MDDIDNVNDRRDFELSQRSADEMRFVLINFDLNEEHAVHVPTVFFSSSPPLSPKAALQATMDIDIASSNGLQVPHPAVLLDSSVFKHDLEMNVTSMLEVPLSCSSSQAQVLLREPPSCSSSQVQLPVGVAPYSSHLAQEAQLELQLVDLKPIVNSPPSLSAPPASSCYFTDEESMMIVQEFMGSNADVNNDVANKDGNSPSDGSDSKQQVRKDNIIKIIDRNINDALAEHQLNEITEAVNQEFAEKVWDGCKGYVEKAGDGAAKKTVQMWISEKKSLAEAIEESLKAYSDIYEKATAVRLYFEDEKSKFEQKVNNFNRESNNQRSYSKGQSGNNSYFGNYDTPTAQHNSNFATIDPYSIEECDPSSSPGSNSKKRKQDDFSVTLNKDNDYGEISNENSNTSNTSSASSSNKSNSMKKQKPFFAGKFNSPLKDKLL